MHHNKTAHIMLLTDRCIDCRKCAQVCPKGVLGRINIIIHKHAHVDKAALCVGCFKCVEACGQNAIVRRDRELAAG